MNKVKDFLLDNKKRVVMLAVIIVSIAVIFALVAVLSKKESKGNEADKDLEITTLADEETIGIEDATADREIGNIDEEVSSQEIETKDALPYKGKSYTKLYYDL